MGGLLSRDDLEDRIERVCRLVSSCSDVLTADDGGEDVAKAACEVALFAAVLRGCGERFASWSDATLGALEPRLRGAPTLLRILWRPSCAAVYGVGHGLMNRAGHRSASLDALLQLVARHPAAESREKVPYEVLEDEWSGRLAGVPARGGSRHLLLDRPAHPLFMSEDDAYAYTHSVFYASDLGSAPLAGERVLDVANVCDAGVAWSLARGDLDLLGEFALAAIYAGAAPSPALRAGAHAWAAAWDRVGFVPDLAVSRLRDGARDRRALFLSVYHAQLVAGLLAAALWARPGWLDRADERTVPHATFITAMLALGRHAEELAIGDDHLAGFPAARGDGASAPASAARVLAGSMGAEVASAVVEALPAESWRACAPDVLVHDGMRRRDLERVLEGVRAGLDAPPSSTIVAALSWLDLFARAVETLGIRESEAVLADIRRVVHGPWSASPSGARGVRADTLR